MGLFTREDKDSYSPGYYRVGRITAGIILGIVGLIFILGLLTMWPFKKVPNGYVGMSYGGGWFEGQHFQGEKVGPKGLFFNGWGDALYLYPATQRNYIVSLHSDEGDRGRSDAITALDSEGVLIKYEVAVYFKLNLDKLAEFHQNIGIKYHAWCNGTETDCSDGWMRMLNDSFRQQLENALQSTTRQYSTDEFLLTETLRNIQTSVAGNLKDNVNSVLGDEYFCGPSFVVGSEECPDFRLIIKKPTLPDTIVDQYKHVQESRIAIQTKENEVVQAEKEAEAIAERQQALESCGQACVLYEAIRAGNITFWVIPEGDLSLTIPAPQTP